MQQIFSPTFDKICHVYLMRELQNYQTISEKTKNWVGLAVLSTYLVAQKAIIIFQFLAYFLQSPHQADIQTVAKCLKGFFWYSINLETYLVKP